MLEGGRYGPCWGDEAAVQTCNFDRLPISVDQAWFKRSPAEASNARRDTRRRSIQALALRLVEDGAFRTVDSPLTDLGTTVR